jgi:hypothetical protein
MPSDGPGVEGMGWQTCPLSVSLEAHPVPAAVFATAAGLLRKEA